MLVIERDKGMDKGVGNVPRLVRIDEDKVGRKGNEDIFQVQHDAHLGSVLPSLQHDTTRGSFHQLSLRAPRGRKIIRLTARSQKWILESNVTIPIFSSFANLHPPLFFSPLPELSSSPTTTTLLPSLPPSLPSGTYNAALKDSHHSWINPQLLAFHPTSNANRWCNALGRLCSLPPPSPEPEPARARVSRRLVVVSVMLVVGSEDWERMGLLLLLEDCCWDDGLEGLEGRALMAVGVEGGGLVE
jgi:hypothetical protein